MDMIEVYRVLERRTEIMERLIDYMNDEEVKGYMHDDLAYLHSKFYDEEDFEEKAKLLLAIDKELKFQGR